jgi:hypothetical protein
MNGRGWPTGIRSHVTQGGPSFEQYRNRSSKNGNAARRMRRRICHQLKATNHSNAKAQTWNE